MPINTNFNPIKIEDFDKTKLMANGMGVKTLIPVGTTASVDLVLTEDHLLSGVWSIVSNGNFGDEITLQIIDTNGTYTGVTGYVLAQFIHWYLPANTAMQFDVPYPAKILGGMSIRAIYKSTGSSDVSFAANYKLHKVLI